MAKSNKLSIEWVATDSLTPYANNPKQHPPDQIAQIAASIREFGFLDPIGIDADGTVIEGHGRLLAAQQLGLETVPVIRLNHLSDSQKRAYLLAHNKLTLNTGWDLERLRLELEALQDLDFSDLTLTGFRSAEIELLFETPSIPDTEPELVVKAETDEGPTHKLVSCPSCGHRFHA